MQIWPQVIILCCLSFTFTWVESLKGWRKCVTLPRHYHRSVCLTFVFFIDEKIGLLFSSQWVLLFLRNMTAMGGGAAGSSQPMECGRAWARLSSPSELPDKIAMAKSVLLCLGDPFNRRLWTEAEQAVGRSAPQNTSFCWLCPHGARAWVCLKIPELILCRNQDSFFLSAFFVQRLLPTYLPPPSPQFQAEEYSCCMSVYLLVSSRVILCAFQCKCITVCMHFGMHALLFLTFFF